MMLQLHRLQLPLEFEFTIARGSISTQPSLVVKIEHDGHRGYGESTANPCYGHTLDSMSSSIEGCRDQIEAFDLGRPEELWQRLKTTLVRSRARAPL